MPIPITAIARFMELGGQTVPPHPDMEVPGYELRLFVRRALEEIQETFDAIVGGVDHAEVLDGFIDTAFAALTGAFRIAGVEAACEAWNAVCDANLAKVDGRHGGVFRDPETGKILKPAGWERPDIQSIIDLHREPQ